MIQIVKDIKLILDPWLCSNYRSCSNKTRDRPNNEKKDENKNDES
jgi:hypothetical protein